VSIDTLEVGFVRFTTVRAQRQSTIVRRAMVRTSFFSVRATFPVAGDQHALTGAAAGTPCVGAAVGVNMSFPQ
jgi:hypothetical protein